MSDPYLDFLARKTQLGTRDGFASIFMPPQAFDFQASLIEWAVDKGRGAIFADCGLGKNLMQLAWAENVVRHANAPVMILKAMCDVAGDHDIVLSMIQDDKSPIIITSPDIAGLTMLLALCASNESQFAEVAA